MLSRKESDARKRRQAKARMKELRHNYRFLTDAEIAAEYPPEKVEQLLKEASRTGPPNPPESDG